MSGTEDDVSQNESGGKQGGVILGCWDHEKTPMLIQDLERSVSLVEHKCKKLLEELVYYKKYLEKSGELDFDPTVLKKRMKKSKNQYMFSGSDPDLTFRRKLVNFQEIQKLFEQKFEDKLSVINKELAKAAHKIGLRDNIILFPTNNYSKTQNKDDEEKSWFYTKEKFLGLNFLTTKSESILFERHKEDEFSKITQNELELYQKLSRLSMKKRKRKFKGRKIRFFYRRNSPKRRLGFKAESESSKCVEESLKRKKKRRTMTRMSKSRLFGDSRSVVTSQEKLDELEIEKMCKTLQESFAGNHREFIARDDVPETKPNLGVCVRKTIPFTTCTSTSKSHNICLNIQQLLSLYKREKRFNLKTFTSGKVHKNYMGQSLRMTNNKQSVSEKERANLWVPLENKSKGFENDVVAHLGRKGKVLTSDCRKVRSKYTGSSPGGFTYHKSTMSHVTNGRKSMIKSESKTAYAVGSKIMVSGCQRTDIFDVGKYSNCFENAAGDGNCNERCAKLNKRWVKVYSSFMSIYRKYTSLKEKILESSDIKLADEEIKSLESEIDYSIEKYKDFLHFYTKFLHLNHRLHSLKIACEAKMLGPVTSFSAACPKKSCGYETNYSMEIKKVFREIQALQDKISQRSLMSDITMPRMQPILCSSVVKADDNCGLTPDGDSILRILEPTNEKHQKCLLL